MSSEGLSIEDKEQHQRYIWNRVGKWRNRWKIKFLISLDLFQVPILTASSWSVFVKCMCKKMTPIQQVLCISHNFFINMLFLESQNIFIGTQNLDEAGVSTFKSLCAKIFQRCNIMYKQPQFRIFPLLLPYQQVADNAHFSHIFIVSTLFYFNLELSRFHNKWSLTVSVYFSNNHKTIFSANTINVIQEQFGAISIDIYTMCVDWKALGCKNGIWISPECYEYLLAYAPAGAIKVSSL